MPFKKGDIVIYSDRKYIVKEDNGAVIILSVVNASELYSFGGVTIPTFGKSYKQIKLYLPEILKKL